MSSRIIERPHHPQVAAWVVVAGTAVVEWLRALAAGAPVSAIPAGLTLVGLCIGLWALAEVILLVQKVFRNPATRSRAPCLSTHLSIVDETCSG